MTDHTPAAQAAMQEGERIAAADEYFTARTWIMDTNDNRRIFEAGFDRAYALLSKLRAPVAKPKRAPIDDWRVQAIADCLEAEWDEMSPDLAESYARTIVGYLIEYEQESDRIEAQHAAEPVHPVVRAVRNLRASAPVADERAAQEYGSPADVAQRIEQYLAHDGRMNSGTQLLYEAMKALRSLARGSK